MAQLLAKDILFYVSEDVAAPISDWKMLVCQDEVSVELTADVTETPTKTCGVLVAPGTPKCTITGSFVCESAPNSTTQVSHQKMMEYLNANTKLSAKVVKVSAEADFQVAGEGYFSSSNFSAGADGFLTGDFTFNFSGVIDVTGV